MSSYDKLFDILLKIRDAREHFMTYSANDIKKLLASKRKAALRQLYQLESMITDLRESLIIEQSQSGSTVDCRN